MESLRHLKVIIILSIMTTVISNYGKAKQWESHMKNVSKVEVSNKIAGFPLYTVYQCFLYIGLFNFPWKIQTRKRNEIDFAFRVSQLNMFRHPTILSKVFVRKRSISWNIYTWILFFSSFLWMDTARLPFLRSTLLFLGFNTLRKRISRTGRKKVHEPRPKIHEPVQKKSQKKIN